MIRSFDSNCKYCHMVKMRSFYLNKVKDTVIKRIYSPFVSQIPDQDEELRKIKFPDVKYEDSHILILKCAVGENKLRPISRDLIKFNGVLMLDLPEYEPEYQVDMMERLKQSAGSTHFVPGLLVLSKFHKRFFSRKEREYIDKLMEIMGYEMYNSDLSVSHPACVFKYNPILSPYRLSDDILDCSIRDGRNPTQYL